MNDATDRGSDDESGEFLEQARWLLEWHDRRGESMTTRATTVLGFVGVVMTLLLQGVSVDGFDPMWWTWLAFVLAMLCLTTAGVCALLVTLPQDTEMPSVGQLRSWWSEQIADPSRGMNSAQIAESILHGQSSPEKSPIWNAVRGANTRASRFRKSAIALLASFVPLAGLVADVLTRSGR